MMTTRLYCLLSMLHHFPMGAYPKNLWVTTTMMMMVTVYSFVESFEMNARLTEPDYLNDDVPFYTRNILYTKQRRSKWTELRESTEEHQESDLDRLKYESQLMWFNYYHSQYSLSWFSWFGCMRGFAWYCYATHNMRHKLWPNCLLFIVFVWMANNADGKLTQ